MSSDNRAVPESRGGFLAWAFLAFMATALGLISLRYALPTIPFPTPLPNLTGATTGLSRMPSFRRSRSLLALGSSCR
jgi:hypothetical protein